MTVKKVLCVSLSRVLIWVNVRAGSSLVFRIRILQRCCLNYMAGSAYITLASIELASIEGKANRAVKSKAPLMNDALIAESKRVLYFLYFNNHANPARVHNPGVGISQNILPAILTNYALCP